MKIGMFKKSLQKKGILVSNGSKHWKLLNPKNGKWTSLLRHPSKEISKESMKEVLKQLGL